MTLLSLRRWAVLPALLIFVTLSISACSTAERAAEGTADVATDVAEGTADVAENVGEAVADAAGATYKAVEDVFDGDDEIYAAALVRPTSGSTVQGTITFEEEGDGTEVEISIQGLTPGEHGIHIHEYGDCSASDGSSAGGHWDPMSTNDHGAPGDEMMARHLGDLGNFTADSDGMIDAERMISGLMMDSDDYSLAGHAIIVHSGRDDLETDPAGDSGNRMACGVIAARSK